MSLKKKLKKLKPPPIPGQVKLLSLLAIVLVCAAPALVSIIDDSMQSEQTISLGSYTEYDLSSPFIVKSVDTPEGADMKLSYIPGSTNGGTHVFSLNTPANKTYVSFIDGAKIDNSVFDAGVSRIVLKFSGSDVHSVRLNTMIPGGTYTYVQFIEILDADGVGTNSFVCDLDSYSLAKIKANDISPSIAMGFNGKFSGVIEMTSETYKSTTIPYGEIIIGATGALLLICAILATPWFGLGKRRSKS